MKKFYFLAIVILAGMTLSACSAFYEQQEGYYTAPGDAYHNGYYGYQHNEALTPLPHPGGSYRGRSGAKPRPYSITPKDQEKYENLNDIINKQHEQSSVDSTNNHKDMMNDTTKHDTNGSNGSVTNGAMQ